MDFDALWERPSLADSPLSLIIRGVKATDELATVRRALELLEYREKPDELVLLVTPNGPELPARVNGKRLRLIVCDNPESGTTLSTAFSKCLHPTVVISDADLTFSRAELDESLKRLEHADLVTSRRPARGHWFTKAVLCTASGLVGGYIGYHFRNWESPVTGFLIAFLLAWVVLNAGRIVRYLFGIPVADPCARFKAVRKPAVDGMTLQCDGALAEVELIAKSTFLTSLIDEIPVSAVGGPLTWWELVSGQLGTLCWSLCFPRFWAFDREERNLRPALHLMKVRPATNSVAVDWQPPVQPVRDRRLSFPKATLRHQHAFANAR